MVPLGIQTPTLVSARDDEAKFACLYHSATRAAIRESGQLGVETS